MVVVVVAMVVVSSFTLCLSAWTSWNDLFNVCITTFLEAWARVIIFQGRGNAVACSTLSYDSHSRNHILQLPIYNYDKAHSLRHCALLCVSLLPHRKPSEFVQSRMFILWTNNIQQNHPWPRAASRVVSCSSGSTNTGSTGHDLHCGCNYW